MKRVETVLVVVSVLSLMACASYRDYTMGGSVNELTKMQTANPEGHQGPKEGLDATKAEIALKVYRRDVSKPEEVKKTSLDVLSK